MSKKNKALGGIAGLLLTAIVAISGGWGPPSKLDIEVHAEWRKQQVIELQQPQPSILADREWPRRSPLDHGQGPVS